MYEFRSSLVSNYLDIVAFPHATYFQIYINIDTYHGIGNVQLYILLEVFKFSRTNT